MRMGKSWRSLIGGITRVLMFVGRLSSMPVPLLAIQQSTLLLKVLGGLLLLNHTPAPMPKYFATPAVTLGELINKFGIDPNDAVLKMDCEGCEFDVILNDYEHVRLFKELILEYHYPGFNRLDDLLVILNRDYKCDIKGYKVKDYKNGALIHCLRK